MSFYWNPRITLTHNSLINVIVGNRGGGKTYGTKELAIDNFLKKGEQFGYIRRYRDDLKDSMPNYFNDIRDKYPNHELRVEGNKFYIRIKPEEDGVKWTDNDIAGYGFTLSTASNKKSISYPNISLLIFDEFLLDKGNQHYLPDEPTKLLNLYETIARPGTSHPRVILFMLANAISITNPYFLYWDLKMPKNQDKNGKWIWKHSKRPILVEDVRNDEFIDAKKNTEFGQLVIGTKYAEYSIENKFFLDDETFIEKRSPKARYYFTFIYKDRSFGVWADLNEGKLWVSKAIDPSYILVYSITLKDHSPNTMLFTKRTGHFRVFIEAYKQGNVYFENMDIKNMCYEILKMSI